MAVSFDVAEYLTSRKAALVLEQLLHLPLIILFRVLPFVKNLHHLKIVRFL
jgi:hypothetical protein